MSIRAIVGVVAASLAVALFAAHLVAPGPADFFIEPTTGMVLVAVRPGAFMMGSPESEPGRHDDETRHHVTLSRLFYMGQHEVTQAEWTKVLKMVKTRAKADLIRGLQSNQGIAGQLAEYQTLHGDWRELFRSVERIDKVTKDDILRVAKATFVPTNRTVAMIVNEKAAESKN